MKILHIAPAWIDTPPQKYGGTELVVHTLAKGLHESGHDATLFATKRSRSPGCLKYVFDRSLLSMGIPWTAALPAALHYHQAFKLAGDYDITHAHLSSQTDLLILPFLSDLSENGTPNVMTIHGHAPFDRASGMDERYLRQYGKRITALSISRFMQRALRGFRNGGVAYNSLDCVPYLFNPDPGDYLAWIGKMLPEKGALEAIRIARRTGQRLLLAGAVDPHIQKSVRYFRTLRPLIDGRQIVYLGEVSTKRKIALLRSAKGLLNPIRWDEPFGMVMLEAMACGTPVISFRRGAAPELITERTGFLAETMREMAAAVNRLSGIDRRQCRRHVERRFSPRSAARTHVRIYRREIERHR